MKDKNHKIFVRDIMTKNVVSLSPETPIAEAARVIAERNLDGAPVVDNSGKLLGILTEYDLISKESLIHLPTFQAVMKNLNFDKNSGAEISEDLKKISEMKVKDVMNMDPFIFHDDTDFEAVVEAFRVHHRVNPIPVVTKDNKVIGVVSRYDVLVPLQKVAAFR